MYKKFIMQKIITPEHLVLIKKKNKLYTFDNDLIIYKIFNLKEISYIIIDKEKIIKKDINNNRYKEYFIKIQLIKSIKKRYL